MANNIFPQTVSWFRGIWRVDPLLLQLHDQERQIHLSINYSLRFNCSNGEFGIICLVLVWLIACEHLANLPWGFLSLSYFPWLTQFYSKRLKTELMTIIIMMVKYW